MRYLMTGVGTLLLFLVIPAAMAQDTGVIGPSPYNFTTESWMDPFAEDGFTSVSYTHLRAHET